MSSKLDLPAGTHTIRIEHTGLRKPPVIEDDLILDAFVVQDS